VLPSILKNGGNIMKSFEPEYWILAINDEHKEKTRGELRKVIDALNEKLVIVQDRECHPQVSHKVAVMLSDLCHIPSISVYPLTGNIDEELDCKSYDNGLRIRRASKDGITLDLQGVRIFASDKSKGLEATVDIHYSPLRNNKLANLIRKATDRDGQIVNLREATDYDGQKPQLYKC